MSNRFQTVFTKLWPRVFVKGSVMIGVLVALGYFVNQIDFEGTLNALNFSDDPGQDWLHGRIGYLLLASCVTAVGGPRQIVSFFAAYFFGIWVGIVLALIGTAIGCLASFMVARIFRNQIAELIRGRVHVALQFWKQNTFSLTLVIRLLPIGSNLMTNLAAGVTGIAALPFLLGSTLGYIPQTVVFAIMGSGVNIESGTRIAASIVLFAVSAAIGIAIYARNRKNIRGQGQDQI